MGTFLHRETASIIIEGFMAERSLGLFRVRFPEKTLEPVESDVIARAMDDSQRLLGARATYLLVATPLAKLWIDDLGRIKSGRFVENEFVLFPYNDGGLISVAGDQTLSFQQSPDATLMDVGSSRRWLPY